jgi:hypothetical protein
LPNEVFVLQHRLRSCFLIEIAMSPLHDRSEEKRTGQCCGADEDLNPIPIHADYFQRLTPGQQLDELAKPNGSTINYATNRSSNRLKLE